MNIKYIRIHTNNLLFLLTFSTVEYIDGPNYYFSKTQRQKTMLNYEGFQYVVNRQSQKNTFWRCNRYVKYGCRAG
jgi:hypothetical protein